MSTGSFAATSLRPRLTGCDPGCVKTPDQVGTLAASASVDDSPDANLRNRTLDERIGHVLLKRNAAFAFSPSLGRQRSPAPKLMHLPMSRSRATDSGDQVWRSAYCGGLDLECGAPCDAKYRQVRLWCPFRHNDSPLATIQAVLTPDVRERNRPQIPWLDPHTGPPSPGPAALIEIG